MLATDALTKVGRSSKHILLFVSMVMADFIWSKGASQFPKIYATDVFRILIKGVFLVWPVATNAFTDWGQTMFSYFLLWP